MKQHIQSVLSERAPELLREIGMLWLVFSVLDRFVSNTLTVSWFSGNVGGALAVWLTGIYIEIVVKR